jgi:SAM-dependent MidA family methyltransferase
VSLPLEKIVLDHIERHGPMPFAAFMSLALYHPKHGYYASGNQRTGWRGHYLTSPELDPAFGQLWARGLEEIWEGSGRTARFVVVEIGPGEGSFAAAVLDSAGQDFGRALQYVLVERIAPVRERQEKRLRGRHNVEWVSSIDEVEHFQAGCVVAHELIDNLPVHLVEAHADGLRELCVERADGGFALVPRPPSNPELEAFLNRVGIVLEDGHRFEIPLAMTSLLRRAESVFRQGALIVVDYGATAADIASRPGGTLVCYSETGVDDSPLERIGEKDITAHVNWTALAQVLTESGLTVLGPRSQREVLKGLGADEIESALKAEHTDALQSKRGAAAVNALSRRQALAALVDPNGLGRLDVVLGTRSLDAPTFMS